MNQVKIIDNRGPNTCLNAFRRAAHGATEISVAVPFLDTAGLRMVRQDLVRVARRGRVRVLVGVSTDAFNDPGSLQSLLVLQELNPKRVEVRVSKFAERFHEKLYLARTGNSLRTIVGSSNLTKKGLSSPSEVNLELSGCPNEQPLRDLWSYFDASFRTNSVPLTSSITSTYRKMADLIRTRRMVSRAGRLWANLRAQLGRQALGPAETAANTWFDTTFGELTKSVQTKVEEETSWTDWYYSCGSRKVYEHAEPGDFLFLIERPGKGRFFTINRIIDKTKIRTANGDYFIAYKRQGPRRSWTPELSEKLRRALVPIPSTNRSALLLSPHQSEVVRSGEYSSADRTKGGENRRSFLGKLRTCNAGTKNIAYALDRFIISLNGGIHYYRAGRDIRYTHKDAPRPRRGKCHPFIHISPREKNLAVHVDEGVNVPKNVDYVFPRRADSPFKLWFSVGGEASFNRVRRDLVRQSFHLFAERHKILL